MAVILSKRIDGTGSRLICLMNAFFYQKKQI